MSTTQEIEARVRAFIADIENLVRRDIENSVRQDALRAVTASLGGSVTLPSRAAAPAAKRGPGRPKGSRNKKAGRKAAAPKAAAPKAAAPKAAASKAAAPKAKAKGGARKKGEKRSRAELDLIEAALGDYVKSNPGLGIEKIGKGMGMPTSELNRPMKKLIAKNAVRFTGEKRATKYYAGSGGGAKKAAKKAGPKKASRKGRRK